MLPWKYERAIFIVLKIASYIYEIFLFPEDRKPGTKFTLI